MPELSEGPEREWKHVSVKGVGTIRGYSRSAEQTFFVIPELSIGLGMLDVLWVCGVGGGCDGARL